MGHRDREEVPYEGYGGEPGTRPRLPGEVEKGETLDTIKRVPRGRREPQGSMSGSVQGSEVPGRPSDQAIEEVDADTVQDPPEGDVVDGSGGLGGL